MRFLVTTLLHGMTAKTPPTHQKNSCWQEKLETKKMVGEKENRQNHENTPEKRSGKKTI